MLAGFGPSYFCSKRLKICYKAARLVVGKHFHICDRIKRPKRMLAVFMMVF